jgi:putative ABC transport system permease protein
MVRQFLCESLLICAAGAVLGLFVATFTFRFLAHLAPGAMTGLKSLELDARVVAFTTAIAALTAIAFGLVPLFQFRRLNIGESLKQSSRALAGAVISRRLRAVLVCAEVALAFVLLIGAGLLIQTFARLRGVDVGCRTENILTLRMPPSEAHRGPGKSTAYQQEVLRRVLEVPGVLSAGFTNHIPLVVKGDVSGVGAEGHDASQQFQANSRIASPGYFRTMGIPLVRGRDFDQHDNEGAPYAAIINETLARTLWPGEDPLGRKLIFRSTIVVPVVGIVRDIHQVGLDLPPKAEFYVCALQVPVPAGSLAVHTNGDPSGFAAAVKRAIWRVDPDQPITEVATMEEILDREVFQRRLHMMLLGVFAGLALLLAAIGLYGVLAYLVGQQVPEIGVRIALGAAPADILHGVVGQGLRLTAVGLGLGVLGALAVSRLIASVLFGVTPTDPFTYIAVASVLLATSALASYVPARRAMRVDPIVALRDE